ncbi:hypothetical protein F1D05_09625 [Kribbella qitaiheensis]|uniref:Uncharacterized protein n=1 Tax=Kribbella qitaiheensis TaxID=1544730 RepID=A0A7G6WVT4_9ACTN|nr:hypothetical protein [Kribbella qitaiheensis]QNE18099.1 hypothetical protein F1D05_09625 [Kribbella qitaiheensis]
MTKPIVVIVQAAEQIRVQQQYANLPQHGLVVAVEQRTTGAGRSILLDPDQIAELRNALSAWLDEHQSVSA